jgi:alanine racemase
LKNWYHIEKVNDEPQGKLDKLQIEGLMSHMAYSNEPGSETTQKQIANFKQAKQTVKEAGLNPTWFHWGGSLALLNDLADDVNVVRCGKAFLGLRSIFLILVTKKKNQSLCLNSISS